MKKSKLFILLTTFLLSGCFPEEIIYVEGFENYRIGQSSVGLVCFPPLDLSVQEGALPAGYRLMVSDRMQAGFVRLHFRLHYCKSRKKPRF